MTVDVKCFGTGCPERMSCLRFTETETRPYLRFVPYTQSSGCFRFVDNGKKTVVQKIEEKAEQAYEKLPEEEKKPIRKQTRRKK